MLKKSMDDFEREDPRPCGWTVNAIRDQVDKVRRHWHGNGKSLKDSPRPRNEVEEDIEKVRKGLDTCDAVDRKLDELERGAG